MLHPSTDGASNQDTIANVVGVDGAESTPSLDGVHGSDTDYADFHASLPVVVQRSLRSKLLDADPSLIAEADWVKLEELSGQDRLWLIGYADWLTHQGTPEGDAGDLLTDKEADITEDPNAIAKDAPPGLAEWQLAAPALEGAIALIAKYPKARITSGRRDRAREAGAWAHNIVKKGQHWMDCLWARKLPEIIALQAWIDDNWNTGAQVAGDEAALTQKVLEALESLDDGVMAKVSPHFQGLAIDVAPGGFEVDSFDFLPNIKGNALAEGDHFHVPFVGAVPVDRGAED